MSHMGMHGV